VNPILRPAYQGSNPVADIFSFWALEQTVKYLPRVAKNKDDTEARRQLLYICVVCCVEVRSTHLFPPRLAASFAGIGFGNAGVHLCHGMSYPVSSLFMPLTSAYAGVPRFRGSTRKALGTNMLAIKSTTLLYPMGSVSLSLALPFFNLPRHPLLTGTAKHLLSSSRQLSLTSPYPPFRIVLLAATFLKPSRPSWMSLGCRGVSRRLGIQRKTFQCL
jgi:hypothetical protein